MSLTLTHTRSFGNEPWYQGKSLLPLNNFVFLCSDGTHCLSNASMLSDGLGRSYLEKSLPVLSVRRKPRELANQGSPGSGVKI